MPRILLMDDEIDYLLLVSISSQKGFKCFDDLLKRLCIGSTNYVNTLCGHLTSILELRHLS